MSGYPPKGCMERGCALHAVYRGRCELHAQSEDERGYGSAWRKARAKVRAEVRSCENCGARLDLTVDHKVPQSMGGTHARANLRVLCRSCHARIGRKVSSR